MSERNYYEVLGVSKSAGADEIHARYLDKMHQVHPDLNAGGGEEAHERTIEVVTAFRLLSDPEARRRYDFRNSNPFRFDGELPGLKVLKGRATLEAEARFAQGLRFVGNGDLPGAVDPFKAALKLQAVFPAASYNLALVGALLGNGPFAIDVLSEGIKVSPKDESLKRLRKAVLSVFLTV